MPNRYTDAQPSPPPHDLPPLPVIDWGLVGRGAPTPENVGYKGPNAPLPKADIVVITWTSAEWSALDHVFVQSSTFRYASSREWEQGWHFYQYQAPHSDTFPLWGYYRMVTIPNASGKKQDVLLFKASAHLAYPPWLEGLLQMMSHIIDEAKPAKIYSIGTAGGSSDQERLGDTAITNSGHISLEKSENKGVSWNNTTVSCKDWYPSFDLVADVEKHLLYPMSNVVTRPLLEDLIGSLHHQYPETADLGYEDLVTDPIEPANLKDPRGLDRKGVPLLSTDYYYIATRSDSVQYCVLEMDDTVVGYAAGQKGIDYAFVRNISDPLVPAMTASGAEIPEEARHNWSGLVFKSFGLYTSMNGALLTWATIAGE